MLKSKKGITLIALIITIIVLLILAGVTINMVLGENGLFGKAKTSVAKHENAQKNENTALTEYETEIDNARETITISREDLKQLISEEIQNQMQSPVYVFSVELAQKARTKGDYYASTNLNSVDNTFTRTNAENFENYFSFEAEKGWTVKKSGWYLIRGYFWSYGAINTRRDIGMYAKINGSGYPIAYNTVNKDDLLWVQGTVTLYFEKDSVIDVYNRVLEGDSTLSWGRYDIFAMCK